MRCHEVRPSGSEVALQGSPRRWKRFAATTSQTPVECPAEAQDVQCIVWQCYNAAMGALLEEYESATPWNGIGLRSRGQTSWAAMDYLSEIEKWRHDANASCCRSERHSKHRYTDHTALNSPLVVGALHPRSASPFMNAERSAFASKSRSPSRPSERRCAVPGRAAAPAPPAAHAAVDTYLNEFVFRYNRRFYRHVSFEALLGLATHHEPTGYWDIIKRDNPRKPAGRSPAPRLLHIDGPEPTG